MRPGPPLLVVGLGILMASFGHGGEGERPGIPVTFVNVSEEAGTAVPHVWGSRDTQRYIVEVKGSGLGFIDFDRDGWLDVFLTNGVRFGETYTPETAPVSHLLRNNRDGTFSDVTARAGVGSRVVRTPVTTPSTRWSPVTRQPVRTSTPSRAVSAIRAFRTLRDRWSTGNTRRPSGA